MTDKPRIPGQVRTLEDARQVVAYVAENRIRWGKQYTGDDVGIHKLMDALKLLAQEDNERITGRDDEIAALNRTIGAAKGREARNENIKAQLREELDALNKENEALKEEHKVLRNGLHDLRNQLQQYTLDQQADARGAGSGEEAGSDTEV